MEGEGLSVDASSYSPPYKRSRLTGAATYGTRFKPEWMSQFPFLTEGHLDPEYSFYCKVCQKDISCRHQGIADVRRHERCKSHIDNVSAVEHSSRLTTHGFVPVGSAIDKQVFYPKIS